MWRTRNTPREEQTRIVSNTGGGGRLLVREKKKTAESGLLRCVGISAIARCMRCVRGA